MSYCRFCECDVYAYDSSDGGVQFYVSNGRRDLDRLCATYNEAYQYAKMLRDTHGLDVPDHAIEALKADALEEAACICGPDSAVAELETQNAKLREDRDGWKKLCTDQEVMHVRREETLDNENTRLRELCAEMYPYAKAFLKEGVMLGCIDSKSYDWFLQLRELGVDV